MRLKGSEMTEENKIHAQKKKGRGRDPFGYGLVGNRWGSNPCFDCGKPTKGIHHVVPVGMGGSRVCPLCSKCHHKVHNMEDTFLPQMIKAGLERARARGVKFGAPKKWDVEVAKKVKAFRKQGKTYPWIAKELGLSVGTVHLAGKAPDESTENPG